MKYGEGTMGAAVMSRSKIGVFDIEGIGQLLARVIKEKLPEYEVIYMTGDKQVESNVTPQIYNYLVSMLQDLVSKGCRVIIVISHTLSSGQINELRKHITIPIIDMAPPGGDSASRTAGKVPIEAVVQAAHKASSIQRTSD